MSHEDFCQFQYQDFMSDIAEIKYDSGRLAWTAKVLQLYSHALHK